MRGQEPTRLYCQMKQVLLVSAAIFGKEEQVSSYQTSSYHPIPSHFYGQVLTLQKHQTPSAGVIFVLTGYRFFPTTIWLMDRSLASKVQGLWPLSPPSTMSLIICTVLLYYISPHHSSSYFQNLLHQLFLPNHTNLPVSTMP